MAANHGSASVPIQIELVSGSSDDTGASRIPGAIAAAAIAPGVVAAIFAADDGERSVYTDLAVLRAGDSNQTYEGVSAPPVPGSTYRDHSIPAVPSATVNSASAARCPNGRIAASCSDACFKPTTDGWI